MTFRTTFEHGDLTKIGELSGVSKQTISALFSTRKAVRASTAERICEACNTLGIHLEKVDCVWPNEATSGLFKGEPYATSEW